MRGVNKVILVGNATRHAELRHTQAGKPVSSLRLVTNRQAVSQPRSHAVPSGDLPRLGDDNLTEASAGAAA